MLTKPQVIAEFRTLMLPDIDNVDVCKELWDLNLDMLFKGRRISKHSLTTWTFPKEFEKEFKKK